MKPRNTGAILLVLLLGIQSGIVIGGELAKHRPAPRPAAPPPAAPYCSPPVKVWPGAGVFPVPECARP
jgi:hypothetical protein